MHKKSLGKKGNLQKKNDSLNPTQGTLYKEKKRNTLPSFLFLFLCVGPETIKKKEGIDLARTKRAKNPPFIWRFEDRGALLFRFGAFLLRSEVFSRVVRSA